MKKPTKIFHFISLLYFLMGVGLFIFVCHLFHKIGYTYILYKESFYAISLMFIVHLHCFYNRMVYPFLNFSMVGYTKTEGYDNNIAENIRRYEAVRNVISFLMTGVCFVAMVISLIFVSICLIAILFLGEDRFAFSMIMLVSILSAVLHHHYFRIRRKYYIKNYVVSGKIVIIFEKLHNLFNRR